ncbi:hypothetical protein EYV94_08075 [Puteibacter caeruleilacunae]|nr:hypothetical protein EYV94_08075 [Puteibacter caeruleilacunae]
MKLDQLFRRIQATPNKGRNVESFLFRRLPTFWNQNKEWIDDDGGISNWVNLQMSNGDRLPPFELRGYRNPMNKAEIVLHWTAMVFQEDEVDDRLNVVALCDDQIEIYLATDYLRTKRKATFKFNFPTNKPIRCYVFFSDHENETYSPSIQIEL